jgi:NIPSNAP
MLPAGINPGVRLSGRLTCKELRICQSGPALYRMRTYQAVTGEPPVFYEFFRTFLLPVQFRHRARLGGRRETEDGLVAGIWEYDDRAAYKRIEAHVRADPDSHRAQEHRQQLPALMTATNETFMSPAIESVPAAMRYLASAGSAAGT